jgi:hypothetical protein
MKEYKYFLQEMEYLKYTNIQGVEKGRAASKQLNTISEINLPLAMLRIQTSPFGWIFPLPESSIPP